MSKLVNREVITAKIESTYNTDPVPAATDAILVEDVKWQNEGLRMNDRKSIRANIGGVQQIYGGHMLSVSFAVELKGSGTAGTAPELGVLLRACAWGETIVASTSVTYLPVSDSHESITLYFYRDGKRFIVTGCRGTVTGALSTGETGKLSFSFTGHVAAETDTGIVTPSYDSTVPDALISVPFAVGGYSAVINALNFDMGNALATPPNIAASDGYGETRITARDVSGSFDPEDTSVAANDWIGDFTAGNNVVINTGVIGATAGNRYQVQFPVAYYRDVSPGDRDGVRTLEVSFGAVESSGDDEISIAFT